MKIGFQLPEVERVLPWGEYRDLARTVEGCGFDSIWVGDHLLFRDEKLGSRGPFEAWTALAGLAEATERVTLGPLVAATSFHSPAMLAKKAATVDEISGGRLVLGLGAGWNPVEYEAFGFAHDNRVARFEEAFTIVRTLIRQGRIDFNGRFYSVVGAELAPRARADMKLMIGSNGPRMLRIAAPFVDMWNTWYAWFDNRPEGLAPLISELEAACEETGRDPSEIERTAAIHVQVSRGTGRLSGSEERPEARPIPGQDLAEHLERFQAAGLGHVQIVLDPIDAAAVEEVAGLLG